MTHLKVTCESHLHINFHEIGLTCVRDSCKSHAHDTLRVETRKFRIKSSVPVALCSLDLWALVHYCIVKKLT